MLHVCKYANGNIWKQRQMRIITYISVDIIWYLLKMKSDPQQGKPWTFAKHVFPEMCSVFFASFLIFWWKSKSVFFSRGKRKIRKNNNKIQHENLNQQRSPTRQDIRTRRSEFKFCHALKEMKIFCFRWLEWENILSCT